MDRQTAIARLAETEEDRVLLARVYERLTAAEQRKIPAATCFLTPREQALTERLLPRMALHRFGGCEGAERAVYCWIPDYLDPDGWLYGEDGPVRAVRAAFYAGDALTHRDFLGALMGSGIKRETVGDVYVGEGICDFVVTREIAPYVLQNLPSAGRTKLRLQELPLTELRAPEQPVRELRDTVSALRLDAVVAAGFGLSRGRAAEAVESGRTSVNSLVCAKPDRPVSEGDKIAVRGLGKLELSQVGGKTKKGRIGVTLRRYV